MTSAFPYDLITLGHFEAGWGWEGQLRSYIKKKYAADLAGLEKLSPEPLARVLGAELVPEKPHQAVLWGLRLRPFRPLELFFFFSVDPEFGTDLRVFYSRKSLLVPTEDAYVFAWDFIALLARYGRGDLPLIPGVPGEQWLPLAALAPAAAEAWERFLLQERVAVVARITAAVARTVTWRLDQGQFQELDSGWSICWSVLPDLLFQVSRQESQVSLGFEAHGAAKYPAELLGSFAWLYLNALLREARQVDPTLPRLSAYF